MFNLTELGKIIRQRRIVLNMTQEELGSKVGYTSRSSINKIELGKVDIPYSKIETISAALQVTPAYLMGLAKSHMQREDRYMKNRLTQLLLNMPSEEVIINGVRCGKKLHTAESIAEYLISQGVLVPPIKVGQTLYAAINPIFEGDEAPTVDEWTSKGVAYEGDGKWFAENEDDEWFELGEELCKLTREEAEKELTVEYDMKLEG